MADVDITVGADTSAVQSGLAELRNTVNSTVSGMKSTFAQAISFTGLTAAFNAILEKADMLHRVSQQFGVDAEQLQLIGNAAKEAGSSFEASAKMMNKLELATNSALEGDKKLIAAFHDLNIDVAKFATLSPGDKVLALADALHTAGLTGETYAATAKLIGTRIIELIPLLSQGSDKIKEVGTSMGVMSATTVEKLDEAGDSIDAFKNMLTVGLGEALAWVTTHWQALVIAIVGGANEIQIKGSAGFKALWAAMKGDFAGAAATWKIAEEAVAQFHAENQKAIDDLLKARTEIAKPPPKPPSVPGGVFAADIEGAKDLETATTAVGTASDSTAAKIRSNQLAAMTDQQKLTFLKNEQIALEQQLAAVTGEGLSALDKRAALEGQIALKLSEIDVVNTKITEDTEKQALADEKSLAAIGEKMKASENELLLQELRTAGREDEAKLLEVALGFENDIEDAIRAANLAYAEGNTKIGDANMLLADQLRLQQANAVAAERTAQAQRAAAAEQARIMAARGGQIGVDQFGRPVGRNDLTIGGLAAGNLQLGGGAFIRAWFAAGQRTDTPDFQRYYQQFQAEEQLMRLGALPDIGFAERARRARIEDLYASTQASASLAASQAQTQSEIAYYQAVFAGQAPPTGNIFTSLYGGLTTGTTPTTGGATTQTLQMSMQISLLQQQLDALKKIQDNLTPAPGF